MEDRSNTKRKRNISEVNDSEKMIGKTKMSEINKNNQKSLQVLFNRYANVKKGLKNPKQKAWLTMELNAIIRGVSYSTDRLTKYEAQRRSGDSRQKAMPGKMKDIITKVVDDIVRNSPKSNDEKETSKRFQKPETNS